MVTVSNDGLVIERVFTRDLKEDQTVRDLFQWKHVDIRIENYKTKEVLFEGHDLEFPEHFSQNACEIIAKMYFRKAGLPTKEGHETSYWEVVFRMCDFWCKALIDEGVIQSDQYRPLFDELAYGMIAQMWAPNSPQWFNTGLFHAYGIKGEGSGLYYYDEAAGKVAPCPDAYSRTQASACFISEVQDSLLGPKSIMDAMTTASRLFKFGSGIGINWSRLRGMGEPMSGGGKSSGLMSFLKVFDENAGAIKSGGVTRRASVLIGVDVDHPEINEFVTWKAKEEDKVLALGKMGYSTDIAGEAYETVSGQNVNNSVVMTDDFMQKAEYVRDHMDAEKQPTITLKGRVSDEINKEVPVKDLWRDIEDSAWHVGDPGLLFRDTINKWNTCAASGEINTSNPCFAGWMRILTTDGPISIGELDGQTVELINADGITSTGKVWCSGEKKTIVLHLSNGKILQCTPDHPWMTDDGETVLAKDLEGKTLKWASSYSGMKTEKVMIEKITDGGIQKVYDFSEPLTHWGVVEGFVAHNCGEFLFLDNSACNLASINVLKFFQDGKFNFTAFNHLVECIQLALEGTIHWGAFPTPEIAENSYLFRPTGLGLSNVGALLMAMALPYDSNTARADVAFIVSNMTASSYLLSAKVAKVVGPFEKYRENKESMRNVLKLHTEAMGRIPIGQNLRNREQFRLLDSMWDKIIKEADQSGFRNAQVTLMAPCGTIGFAMDCASTGIEPFFAHIVWKKVVDGSYIQLVNPLVKAALLKLGYAEASADSIIQWMQEHDGNIEGSGIHDDDLAVFDTANRCGSGSRYIAPRGHVDMVAAIQPHISGGQSKTINLPSDASMWDIGDIYLYAWKKGCKGITVYRDGCKVCQPLNTATVDKSEVDELEEMSYADLLAYAKDARAKMSTSGSLQEQMEALSRGAVYDISIPAETESGIHNPAEDDSEVQKLKKQIATLKMELDQLKAEPMDIRPTRERLPNEPKCIKNSVKMEGNTYHIQRSFYDDGRLGEIFVTVGKQGSTIKGLVEVMCIIISKCLQYGVKPEIISKILRNTDYAPNGFVNGHENIKSVTSITDMISKFIDISMGDYRFCQVKPKPVADKEDDPVKITVDTSGDDQQHKLIGGERVFGRVCSECGSDKIVKAGTCYYCQACGASTGCS